jgi:YD repeat-containing protein
MKNSELSNLSMQELSDSEQMNIQGGSETVYFTDTYGYNWSYYYDDSGNLTGWCVSQVMIVR